MNYREVVNEAWGFTQENKKMIIWYAFFPSLLTTLAGILLLIYQYFALRSSPLFENWDRSFTSIAVTTVLDVIRSNFSSSVPFIIIAVIIVLLYIFVPAFCEGAIIQLIARKKNGHAIRTRDGIRFGFLSFLPIFEYTWLIRTFSLVSMLTQMSFIGRNLGLETLKSLLPIFVLFAIAGIIMTVLFTYSEFFIIIDDNKVMESIAKSSTLVITHLEETLLLLFLMLIISVRIILQILIVLLIPGIIFGFIYLFASSAFPAVGITIGTIIGLIFLYAASYLSGTIHVFAATVWTFTFLKLTDEGIVSARENFSESDEIRLKKREFRETKRAEEEEARESGE